MTSDESHEFFWKIPDFLKRKEKVNESIVSPEFTSIDRQDKLAKFELRLYPKGCYNRGDVEVDFSKRGTKFSEFACRCYILSTENRYEHEVCVKYLYIKLISIADLEKRKSTLLHDGALTLVLKFDKLGRLFMK